MKQSRWLHLCLALIAPIAFAASANAQTCVDSPDDLIAWWPGDGSTMEVESGLDAKLVGGADFGPGLAAEALLLASLYAGESELREQAKSTLATAGTLMSRYPSAVGHHLAIAFSATRTQEVAIVGSDWPSLAEVYWDRFRPQVVLAVSSGGDQGIPLLADRHRPETTLGYVCRDFVCERPVTQPDELRALLDL